ncbi:hypothetical protein KDL30_03370 [bacterium]|nr:hypothetical protein [bacterium]
MSNSSYLHVCATLLLGQTMKARILAATGITVLLAVAVLLWRIDNPPQPDFDPYAVWDFSFNDRGSLAVVSGTDRWLYLAREKEINLPLLPNIHPLGMRDVKLIGNGEDIYFIRLDHPELYVIDEESKLGYRQLYRNDGAFIQTDRIFGFNTVIRFSSDDRQLPMLISSPIYEDGVPAAKRVRVIDSKGQLSVDEILPDMFACDEVLADLQAGAAVLAGPGLFRQGCPAQPARSGPRHPEDL